MGLIMSYLLKYCIKQKKYFSDQEAFTPGIGKKFFCCRVTCKSYF
ncbi:Uncharacterised protein [Klebsiella quasipneumoniae]|nr:Uncharacterised protein [Klebsiella quasipneumoniae]